MGVSTAMKAHLAGNTTLCQLWKITAKDGTIVRVCNHTQNISYLSELYLAVPMNPTQIKSQAGLETDHTEITSILDSDFSEVKVRGGKWNNARIEITTVNYLDLSMGPAEHRVGFLGQVTLKNAVAVSEFVSLSQKMAEPLGDLYSYRCRVRTLGQDGCLVVVSTFTFATTILTVASQRFPVINLGTAKPDNYFSYGWMDVTSGANAGLRREIILNTGNAITLFEPFPLPLAIGDGVNVVKGCDRTRTMCRDDFAMVANIQAEPDIPGTDKIYTFPV